MTGKLILVPTPIGNLGDFSPRSVEVLKDADAILAEDTRITGFLLKHFEIKNSVFSYHQANEHKVLNRFLERLETGETLAMVSDSGSPGISDPGFLIVRACVEKGIPVESLPGPTAFVPALTVSGLPCDRFYFEGFLPHKKGRKTRIDFILNMPCTVVLYESPHRILKTLEQLSNQEPSRNACVSREISKKFEEHTRGSLLELYTIYKEKEIKGEFVIIIEGKS